jgi:methyl-accepting chemotaxis protein
VMKAAVGATEQMHRVLSLAEDGEAASQAVLSSADEVGQTSSTLRGEVQHFLAAMSDSNGNEVDRRRYERIAGGDSAVKVRAPGHDEAKLRIKDISRGGVSLICDWPMALGTEVACVLPYADQGVMARVARTGQGLVALSFRQDKASLTVLDQVLDAMAHQMPRAA